MNKLNPFTDDKSYLLKNLSIDCVILGFHDNQLKVLLLKYKNTNYFGLPGGFIHSEEDLDAAALRILEERTALKNIYLEQFYVFGNKERRNDQIHIDIMEAKGVAINPKHFVFNRFISVGYYALIDFSKASPTPDALSDSCEWYDLENVPQLIFDHNEILNTALETLRKDLDEKLIGFNLLPETFTMNEIQKLYETILGEKIIRSNFQRKMLSLNILERIEKKMTGAANKAPYLYKFIGEN